MMSSSARKLAAVALALALVLCAVAPLAAAQDDDEWDDEDFLDDEDLLDFDDLSGDAGNGDGGPSMPPRLDGACGCGGDPVEDPLEQCGEDLVYARENTPLTTALWVAISTGSMDSLCDLMAVSDQCAAFVAAEDSRSALHWAFEFGQADMASMLICVGADEDLEDASGKIPRRLKPRGVKMEL